MGVNKQMVLYALLTSTPFYLAGWVAILGFVVSLAERLWALYAAKQDTRSLPERYGKDSYVLITGASDGIGKAMAFSFAARGMNLILVARNATKLGSVKTEILKQHPSTKVEIYICDFSKSLDPGFFANLFAFTSQFDVSIVVNNVGVATLDFTASLEYKTKTVAELLEIMVVNTVPQTCLQLLYQKQFKLRKSRCAFLDVSSSICHMNVMGAEMYAATKLFDAYLTKSLGAANSDSNIDFLAYYLGPTRTAMTAWAAKKMKSEPPMMISASEAAESIIPFLGKSLTSAGHWKHFAIDQCARFMSHVDDTTPYTMLIKGTAELYKQNQGPQ